MDELAFDDPFVFISYAKEDWKKARELYRRLRGENLRPWLDLHHLRAGEDWASRIPQAIAKSRFFVVLLSLHAVNKRGYVQREISIALKVAEELPEGQIFILPARLEDCDVPTRLQRWQWIDLFKRGGTNRLQNDIINALGDRYEKPTKRRPATRKPRHDAAIQRIRELLDNTGAFLYCSVARGRFAVSNRHFLVFLSKKPAFFDEALSNLRTKQLSKSNVTRVAPPKSVYVKSDNLVVTTEQAAPSTFLLKSATTQVHVSKEYWDLFSLLFESHKAYIIDSDTPVCFESDNKLVGILMPLGDD